MKRISQRIPKDFINDFYSEIEFASALRMRVVVFALGLLQLIQLVIYLLTDNDIFHDFYLIFIKAAAVILSIIFVMISNRLIKTDHYNQRHVRIFVIAIQLFALAISIFNTFKAQSITSDISIYMMVLFILSVTVRLEPYITAAVYLVSYSVFLIGMPYFQKNMSYLSSHLINGLIFNIIAFVIAYLFYNNSITDFLDKLEINLKNKELTFLSQHDGLTGLYNHQTIHELLENALIKVSGRMTTISILLIDLDGFKEINDVFGHSTGDTVLKQVSQKINKSLRINDRAGRYGGDEFLIILTDTTSDEAQLIANKLLEDVRTTKLSDSELTFSCGVAQWKEGSATHLIEKADRGLYQVKNNGKNGVLSLE